MAQEKVVTNEDILNAVLDFVQVTAENFTGLEKRLDRLEIRMDRLEKQVGGLERRLDIVEHDIAGLKQTSYRQEQSLGRAIAVFEMAHQKRQPSKA